MPKAKPAVLRVCGKTSDQCGITVHDSTGKQTAVYDGYVPDFFPGQHYGDYLELQIDIKTGRILNWVPPTQVVLTRWIDDKCTRL